MRSVEKRDHCRSLKGVGWSAYIMTLQFKFKLVRRRLGNSLSSFIVGCIPIHCGLLL